jgi:hypothetical protein
MVVNSFEDALKALKDMHVRQEQEIRREYVRKMTDKAVGVLINRPHIKSKAGRDFAYHEITVLFNAIAMLTNTDGDEWLTEASELALLDLTQDQITDRLVVKFC